MRSYKANFALYATSLPLLPFGINHTGVFEHLTSMTAVFQLTDTAEISATSHELIHELHLPLVINRVQCVMQLG